MSDWRTDEPPNEVVVEVKDGRKLIRAMAFYGRDGYRPHWRTPGGDTQWEPAAFKKWRPIP